MRTSTVEEAPRRRENASPAPEHMVRGDALEIVPERVIRELVYVYLVTR